MALESRVHYNRVTCWLRGRFYRYLIGNERFGKQKEYSVSNVPLNRDNIKIHVTWLWRAKPNLWSRDTTI